MKNFIYIFTSVMLLASSCKVEPNAAGPITKNGVYITNEGDFNTGQGEISFYDPASGDTINNIFYNINRYHLGDVVQSMYIKDSTGFIVVNNSSKVEVVKIPSLKHILTINIANSSPRYFLPVNDSVGYVTELYASKIHVVNYKSGNLITDITGVAKWTEHILMLNGNVVVEERSLLSNPSATGSIVTINPANNTVMQRYTFAGSNIDGMISDNLNRLWLGLDADSAANILSSLYCVNTDMSVNKRIVLSAGHIASNLKINGAGNQVYYLDNNGVNTVSINDTIAPVSPFSATAGRNLYGLGVDPRTGDVYVSDALDYVQNSRVYRYDSNGNLIQAFTAGVISGNFAFSYQ